MVKETQTPNAGYMGRIFTANGFQDHAGGILSSLNGSAPYLRDVGELAFLIEKAEHMFFSLKKLATVKGILSMYSCKRDEFDPVKIAQSPDLSRIYLQTRKSVKTEEGKPAYEHDKKIMVSDLALALMKNLDYRRENLEKEIQMYEQIEENA
ncbi:MAG: hypothetical protein KKE20_01825 [Nanoarchaeota archaeon]|nr:hypothetical protein [Nanoarchaeota archaeon]